MFPKASEATGPLTVGEHYRVECLRTVLGKRRFWVPILCSHVGDISGEFHHHIDVRFLTNYILKIKGVERPDHILGFKSCKSNKLRWVVKKCVRQFPLVQVLEHFEEIDKLQEIVKNRSVDPKRMKCPHQEMDLRQVPISTICGRSVRVCPAHGLAWDAETGEPVKRLVDRITI